MESIVPKGLSVNLAIATVTVFLGETLAHPIARVLPPRSVGLADVMEFNANMERNA
jgi:hypothetical protein